MSIVSIDRVPAGDLADLATTGDLLGLYAEWRAAGPLLKGGPLQWLVTRHADVSPLLRDRRLVHRMPRAYLAFALGDGAAADFRERSLLNRDGTDHTRLRILMGKAFSAPLVRRLRAHVTDLVDELLEPLLDGEPYDAVPQLANALPGEVVCELLGIRNVDRDEVARHTRDLTSSDNALRDAATIWVRAYLSDALDDRVPDPDGDLLQRMLAAEEGTDALTHAEIVDNAALLFFAGFETTKHVIASGLVSLDTFAQERRRLLATPELSTTGVEELLRYDGPVPSVAVVVAEPVEVGGRVIPAGHVLHLLLGCANHDDAAFSEAGVLDLSRHPNPHVAFGGGVHHCLGSMLARIELDVVFRRLAERTLDFGLAAPPVRLATSERQYSSVPLVARAA